MKSLNLYIVFISFILTQSLAHASFKTYQFPEAIQRSDKYEITIRQGENKQTAFVHISECPEQKYPLEKILPLLYDRTFSWTSFEFTDAPVNVTVKKLYGGTASNVLISPKKYGILPMEFDGQSVTFEMQKPEYISVRFVCDENTDEYGQIKHGLMLFADEPETDIPDLKSKDVVHYQPNETMFTAPIIYFSPGVYHLVDELPNGVLPLHDNQTVYIHPEAYIFGGITAPSTYNVKVIGRGVIDGQKQVFRYPGLPQLVELEPWNHRTNVHRGGHATVEGITFLHSYKHNCAIGPNSFLKDLKFIAWTVNSDGIRSVDDCIIDHVFMKVSDDHLYAFSNSLITNSIFWPMWNGAILQLSWGHYGGGGTRFVNNVVINPEYNQLWANNGIIASMARPHAKFNDILLQDLIVEGDINALANLHYSTFETGAEPWTGYIRNITFRNIDIQGRLLQFNQQEGWYDTIPADIRFDVTPETPVKLGYDYFKGYKDSLGNIAPIENVVYENVRVNGVYLTNENYRSYVHIDEATTKNIQFIRTDNFDPQLSPQPGFVRSNQYSLAGKGAGSHPQSYTDEMNIRHYGWLQKGENCKFTIDLQQAGMFRFRASIGYLLNKAQVDVLIDNQKVMDGFELQPKTDDGNNYLVIATNNTIELGIGIHTIECQVMDGYCIPDYFELQRVMDGEQKEWKAEQLNIGVAPGHLKYNSREEANINSDERGPTEPLGHSHLYIYDFEANQHYQHFTNEILYSVDIRSLPDNPYFAVFSDNESFWLAKVFVK